MTDLTGKKIANTYKDLLQINSSASNSGVDGTLRVVQDGGGKSTSLKLSQTEAAFSGNVSVNGNMTVIGTFQPDTINASEIGVSTLSATNITTDTLTAETLTFQDVSVSSLRVGIVSAGTINAGTNITIDGEQVVTSAIAASVQAILRAQIATSIANTSATLQTQINSVSATVSAVDVQTSLNAVNIGINQTSITANASSIAVNSAAITSVNTRINAVSVLAETKASASTSANLETRINAVSVLADTKASASTSANLETRINAVSVLADTKASASTSANLETRINSVSANLVSTSAALESHINTVSASLSSTNTSVAANASAIAVNSAAITSVNTRINDVSVLAETKASASTSANLETRINAVSVLAETKASASTSANLETRINAVSVLAETKASASTSANLQTQIATLSATMATSIATLSATMATSISNHLPLSGGTLTGALTLNADPTADLGAATKQYVDNLTAAGIHLHDAVRVETPSALTATYDNGTAGVGATLTNSGTQAALSIDGITLSTSDRVLVRQQSNQAHNGVYVVTNVGSASTNWILTRSDDADSSGDGSPDTLDEGSYFFVNEGDTGAGDAYVCNTQGTITFGTTNITFAKFSDSLEYTAGTGININASRVISVSAVASAGTSATLETRINAVSAITKTNADAIASINTAISAGAYASAGTSATLETRTNAVSVLAETKASASTSANLETRIATVSSTMATSINNQMPKTGGTFTGDVTLEDTDAGSAAGPEFTLYRNSSSPADGDYLGQIKFNGENDAGQNVLYAKITGKISDVTDTTEDGLIETAVKKAGSNVIVSRQTGDALKLINGTGLEVAGDATITGNVTATAFYGDGSNLTGLSGGGTMTNITAGSNISLTEAGTTVTETTTSATIAVTAIPNFTELGINTASPAQQIHATTSTTNNQLRLTASGGNANLGNDSTGGFVEISGSRPLSFYTGGSERMRLDSSGKLGIGVTPASDADALDISSSGTNAVKIVGNGNDTLYSYHDGGGTGWSTGADGSYTNLIYFKLTENELRFYLNSAERVRFEPDGDIHADGNVIAYSTTILIRD